MTIQGVTISVFGSGGGVARAVHSIMTSHPDEKPLACFIVENDVTPKS